MALSDRELASLVWLAVFAGLLLTVPGIRGSLGSLVWLLLGPAILLPLSFFGAYMAAIVFLASLVGAWDQTLLKDTVIWFIGACAALFFDANKVAERNSYFWIKARHAVRASVFLEFYLNLHTLSFSGELVLQGWVLFISLMAVAGGLQPSFAAVKRTALWLQALTGLAAIAYVGAWLTSNWGTLDPWRVLRDGLLPVWLTLFALPAIFLWSVYITYNGAFSRVRQQSPNHHLTWRSRFALWIGYGVRIRDLQRRRTITGWVFAVGATGPPPQQWFYDGPHPPNSYPQSDPPWPSDPFDQGVNWTQ
jgi:hypothetical protein